GGRPIAERALEREVRGRVRRDVLLERVVVQVLLAVREVRPGDTRRRADAREVVPDPDLPPVRAEAAGDPVQLGVALDPRVVRREVPGVAREVLERDVLELRALADEELGDRVRVARQLGRRRGVLLDQREPRAGLGHDEQPPEERAPLGRVPHANVERLLELDALRDDDEQAVLPERGVVRGELLVGADELAEPRVVAERLEDDSLGGAVDRDPALAHPRDAGRLDLEHRLRRIRRRGVAVRREGVRVEAGEIREAPVLVGGRRERQLAVAVERVDASHSGAYLRCSISAFPSGSAKKAMWQTPVSSVSPRNSTPFASSSARASATSGTRSASSFGVARSSTPNFAGSQIPSVT